MPFPGLRSRPETSASQNQTNDSVPDSPKRSVDGHRHERKESFKRLSLRLTKSNGDTFDSIFTHEPAEIESRRQSVLDTESPITVDPKSSSTPAAFSRLSSVPDDSETPAPQPTDEAAVRPQRFSLLRFRNASDPQLSTRFKKVVIAPKEEITPAPTIITTAPTTNELDESVKRTSKQKKVGSRNSTRLGNSSFRRSFLGLSPKRNGDDGSSRSIDWTTPDLHTERSSLGSHPQPTERHGSSEPPAYGDESNSQLAIPVDRLSDSSRSDGSFGDHGLYAQTTTTHTISTTTTFFKLKRRKKDKGPLFPLPERFPRPASGRTSISVTPRLSTGGRKSMSPSRASNTGVRFDDQPSPTHSPGTSTLALTNAPFGSPGPSVLRKESTLSTYSGHSTPSVSLLPPRLGARGRSSTMGSLGRSVEKLVDSIPPPTGSARTSTSTSGRRSFGDLLALPHRLRQNSAPAVRHGFANTPSTPGSKSNSIQIPRDAEPMPVYPQREESDTPASYLEKLEAAVPRGVMATILCKSADEFAKTCLRKYMRGFSYFGESIDMSIRKMLMEVELPKETQQIDRLLAGFADRYHECNPGIFASADEAGFVAFSILLLHSDTHNKNNKRKMQKADYVKNTQQAPMVFSNDILECFYDNICYTPFIHFEDEVAINSHRLTAPKPRKSLIRTKSTESLRGPVDPYSLILDNKLELLKPSLKEVMDTEDTYKSFSAGPTLDANELHAAFQKSSVLQIISARSRPDAFLNQATISNPAEAQAGLVSIKVAKVGLLWRKDPKKKKAKRPWQEWGAILTDSKLYFFKDVGWVKKLVTQYESHPKQTGKAGPLIFKPPVSSFEPDALMSMDDAVALLDSSYKKHKHAFTFIKHGGFEEVFLANTEAEMYDWMAKLNYAATFRTAGVRMRGLLGTNYEGKRMLRKDSEISMVSNDTLGKDSTGPTHSLDHQAAWEIMFYRQQLINEKISDFDERIAAAQRELENLLRNARHLLILLPVQAKTREALVLAAGRMSAKLKWTRVELWRTRTHRDILVKDLEQEGSSTFPVPNGRMSVATTPQKATPIKTGHPTIGRANTDHSRHTLSPGSITSPTSRRPSQSVLEKISSEGPAAEKLGPPEPTMDSTVDGGLLLAAEPVSGGSEFNPASPKLVHQASTISSHRALADAERYLISANDSEEQILREAGVMGGDPSVGKEKRPDTSGSERDRVGAISPTSEFMRERGGSVRRSLHRTLRDPHVRESLQSHTSPGHHRHKKGRESGSSFVLIEDGAKLASGDSPELKRGAGSFILHGKKASVVTMSPEWQAMSNEDRLRLRTERKGELDHKEMSPSEEAVEDGTISNVSRQTSPAGPGSPLSKKQSAATTTTDDEWVDAQPSLDSPELKSENSP